MKEYDIHLAKRLTECDVIIYALPYRDGFTAYDRLIMDTSVTETKLSQYVSMELGVPIGTSVGQVDMEKFLRVSEDTQLCTEADIRTQALASLDPSAIYLGSSGFEALAIDLIQPTGSIHIGASDTTSFAESFAGTEMSSIDLGTSLNGTLKVCMEQVSERFDLVTEADFLKLGHPEPAASSVAVGMNAPSLCYTLYMGGTGGLAVEAESLTVGLSFSSGRIEGVVSVSSSMDGPLSMEKYDGCDTGVMFGVSSDLSETKSFVTEATGFAIDSSASLDWYTVLLDVDSGFEISANSFDLEGALSAGRIAGDISVDASLEQLSAKKSISIDDGTMLGLVIDGGSEKYAEMTESGVFLSTQMSVDMRRYRKLSELDGEKLSAIDGYALDRLDYIDLDT